MESSYTTTLERLLTEYSQIDASLVKTIFEEHAHSNYEDAKNILDIIMMDR